MNPPPQSIGHASSQSANSHSEQVAERLQLYLETLGLPRQIREALTEQAMAVALGSKGADGSQDMTMWMQEVLTVAYDALMGRGCEDGLDGRIWKAARALCGVAADQELACQVLPPLSPGHMAPHW